MSPHKRRGKVLLKPLPYLLGGSNPQPAGPTRQVVGWLQTTVHGSSVVIVGAIATIEVGIGVPQRQLRDFLGGSKMKPFQQSR